MKKILLISLVVTAFIGLWADHAMAFLISDSFEGSALDPSWQSSDPGNIGFGNTVLSTDFAHSGFQSFKMGGGPTAGIVQDFGQEMQGDLSIWVNSGLLANDSLTTAPLVAIINENTFLGLVPNNIDVEGWHKVALSVDDDGLKLFIDDVPDNSFNLPQPPVSFHAFQFGIATIKNPDIHPFYYFDDFGADIHPLNAVPEPSSLFLLGIGLAGIARMRRRSKK